MDKILSFFAAIFWCSLILLTSCTERFRPELNDFENNLVVDGLITNEEGPYTIRLSLSSDLGLIRYTPLENATVKILEKEGASESLMEVSAGVYETSATGIKGKVGNSYKLQIENADGRMYETEYQVLKAPTAIADVYVEIETKFFTEENTDITGYQFYVDAEASPNEQDYFLWLSDATFKYKADYPIVALYDGNDVEFTNEDSLTFCWRKDTVNYATTYFTGDYADPSVKKIPLHFVKSTDIALSLRYSPKVKQYTISEEAYVFWKALSAQLQTDAALYSTQPYQTRGNIKNINDAEETVLGFFLVAGVSEKRIFVNAPVDLPLFQLKCFYDYEGYSFRWIEPETSFPIYVTEDADRNRAMMPRGCLDCRDNGGDIIEPDFWED